MKDKTKKLKLKKSVLKAVFLFTLFIIILTFLIINRKEILDFKFKNIFTKDQDIKENIYIEDKDFTSLFRNRLPSVNLNFASSSEIYENLDMKIYIKGSDEDTGYIYVNTKDNANYVWVTFISAIDTEPLKSKLEKNLKNLEYIDLRFSNKVFYKFKDNIKKEIIKDEEDIINNINATSSVSTSTNILN